MEVKRKISYKKHLLALFFTLTIFVFVFSFDLIFNKIRILYLQEVTAEIGKEVLLLDTTKSDFCLTFKESDLTDRFYNLRNNLLITKNSLREDDENIISLKKEISLIQLEYLTFIEKTNYICNSNFVIIIHIYFNEEERESQNKLQKAILISLNNKFSNLRVFFFDSSLDLPEINLKISNQRGVIDSKQEYDKQSLDRKKLSLIINNKRYYDFINIEELKNILIETGAEPKIVKPET